MRGVDQQKDGDGRGLALRAGPLQPREQGGGPRDDPRHQAATRYNWPAYSQALIGAQHFHRPMRQLNE